MLVRAVLLVVVLPGAVAGVRAGRINLTGDDIDETLAASHPAGQMLHLIAKHVAMLEDRMSALTANLDRAACG